MKYHLSVMDWERAEFIEDGYYSRLDYYVSATNDHGDRWMHFHAFSTQEEAYDLLNEIRKSMEGGYWKGPENNPHWEKSFPVYGSDAYCATNEHMYGLEPELNPWLSEDQKHWEALHRDESQPRYGI